VVASEDVEAAQSIYDAHWGEELDEEARVAASREIDLDAEENSCPACGSRFATGGTHCPECGLRVG